MRNEAFHNAYRRTIMMALTGSVKAPISRGRQTDWNDTSNMAYGLNKKILGITILRNLVFYQE